MALSYKNENVACSLECTGDILTIVADVSYLITKIHSVTAHRDPATAMLFKALILHSVAGDNSPVWKIRDPNEGEVCIRIQKPPQKEPDA